MLLQKEVEKLNFENTFLRLKLDNLNKKLIEIEALMNNNWITAIEMSTLAEVPFTSHDGDDDKEKIQCDDNIVSKTSPDSPSSVSTRQPLSTQYNLGFLFLKENNQNVCRLGDSEYISSIDILPKESHSHSDQSSKSFVMSKIKNIQSISCKKEKLSLSNVNKRKKHVSSWESILQRE